MYVKVKEKLLMDTNGDIYKLNTQMYVNRQTARIGISRLRVRVAPSVPAYETEKVQQKAIWFQPKN